ncbi:ATP-binding protein [Actinoplanes sp. NPDC048791]|uniref:PAS domain-containing sensor histidine kinase n=1 Tax=Actinoplanes sp. NPDC048791 TaxID=3154623 RepID=UPI00340E4FBB
MPDQIFLLGNTVIMVAYAAVTAAIAVPVARAGQLRTNRLATATALIFFSCAVGHGFHASAAYQALFSGHAHAGMTAGSWAAACWDLLTAAVGVYYWTLRRSYGVMLRRGAIYPDPAGQQHLDVADARERAAQDLAESHRATLAAVVEHSDDAIIGVTPAGTVTAWNGGAERLFGYTAAEVVGHPASMLADSEGLGEQSDVLSRIAAGERSLHYEATRVHKDGSPLEIAVSVAPIRGRDDTIIGVSVVARDIAAAKQAAERRRQVEERTHQAQRMESLGKLAGGVAHDFNNILAIIVNYTDFAAEQSADPAVRADLEHVRIAADRAISLTHQLLVFTRGDTIQPQDIDLNASIDEVRAMLHRTIGEDIDLRTEPAPAPLTVHADAGQIQQVLLNLSLNARDAMPQGGTLVIEADRARLDEHQLDMHPELAPGAYARLQVSDTGEGIEPEVAAHIFEPFYTTKPRGQGTGLGLSTVYGIVAEAGGSINVYSEPGVGTTFRVYLPLVETARDAGVTRAVEAAVPQGHQETVLVVEDEPALGRIVARILSQGGYRVLSAASGPEALELDRDQGCDLLLTDVIMPGMSGPRLAELLAARHPGLPVLFMSGYSNGLLGSTHVLDPDIAFIEKPFTADDLLRRVSSVLSSTTTRS